MNRQASVYIFIGDLFVEQVLELLMWSLGATALVTLGRYIVTHIHDFSLPLLEFVVVVGFFCVLILRN